MRTRLYTLVLLVAASMVIITGQSKPPSGDCEVADDAPLALVIGSKPAELWKVLSPMMRLLVPAGHPVAVGKHEREWTCVSHYGSGDGWMLSNRLRPIEPDLHPPPAAWIGVWTPLGVKKQPRDATTEIVISAGAAPGRLKLEGQAYWFGPVVNGERVMHDGAVAGEAQTNENRLHITDGSCEVDLALIAGFLSVRDNRDCGGMNVTFSGVWQKRSDR